MTEPPPSQPPEALVPTETANTAPDAGAVAAEAAPAAPTAVAEDAATLRRQRDEYYELLLRVTAEFDNYRKRIERERKELADQIAADLLRELLPIVDDLERALQADGVGGSEPYRRGVELIYHNLLELLRRWGATPIEAVGARFDPRLHQAVAYEEAPGHQDGDIVEEYRRGYTLGGRLVRPSLVKVAKA